MKKMQALWNDNNKKVVEQTTEVKHSKENLIFFIDLAIVAENIKSTKDEPQAFNKAWNHPCHLSWRKWQVDIQKEFSKMKKWQV